MFDIKSLSGRNVVLFSTGELLAHAVLCLVLTDTTNNKRV